MSEPGDETVVSRRGLLRLAGAAGLTIAATGAVLAATAAPAAAQAGWRYCINCHELWWHGSASLGNCPHPQFGGHDDTSSSHYEIKFAPTGAGQDGWRWCYQCNAMFYPRVGAPNRCPGTHAGHDDWLSGNYKLENTSSNGSDGPGGQSGWRICTDCGCLWHEPSSGSGYCWVVGVGGHMYNPNWYNYILRT